jgi:hypothetical protein
VIFGTGDTWVWDGGVGSTSLTATAITQNSLNIGGVPPAHPAPPPMPVPEPSVWVLLTLAATAILSRMLRKR